MENKELTIIVLQAIYGAIIITWIIRPFLWGIINGYYKVNL